MPFEQHSTTNGYNFDKLGGLVKEKALQNFTKHKTNSKYLSQRSRKKHSFATPKSLSYEVGIEIRNHKSVTFGKLSNMFTRRSQSQTDSSQFVNINDSIPSKHNKNKHKNKNKDKSDLIE